MFIDGFALGGYRSFGTEPQTIAPLAKVNLIAGQNNSGKSNILSFVTDHYGRMVARAGAGQSGELSFGPLDAHRSTPASFHFSVATKPDGSLMQAARESLETGAQRALDLASPLFVEDDGLIWFRYGAPSTNASRLDPNEAWLRGRLDAKPGVSWQSVRNAIENTYSHDESTNVNGVAAFILRRGFQAPRTVLIPAIRQIGSAPIQRDRFYGGDDLIVRLAELQHPSIDDQHKREQFEEINNFARSVLDVEDVELEIPVAQDTIHVRIGHSKLPLDHLGTGIHEVIMLAAWATTAQDSVVCIEEPELHLHPILQEEADAIPKRTYVKSVSNNHAFCSPFR